MMSIKSIIFRNENKGLCCENDITSEELEITRTGAIVHRQNIGLRGRMIHWYDYQLEEEKANQFMNKLIDYYKLHQWEGDYSISVADDMRWEISYELQNLGSRKIQGTQELPSLGYELKEEVLSLVNYVPKPRILCDGR